MPRIEKPVEDRFWSKVNKTESCWNWSHSTSGKSGYGKFFKDGKMKYAHRVAYELIKGLIPHNLFLDHLCRNRLCVNPNHLEIVTNQENCKRGLTGLLNNYNSRKTHCSQGHEFSIENTSFAKYGEKIHRRCKTCKKIYDSKRDYSKIVRECNG